MRHHDIDPDVFVGMHGGYGDWLDAAKAVLETVREPSEGQIEVGIDLLTERGCNPLAGDAEAVWAAMIDAALSE